LILWGGGGDHVRFFSEKEGGERNGKDECDRVGRVRGKKRYLLQETVAEDQLVS